MVTEEIINVCAQEKRVTIMTNCYSRTIWVSRHQKGKPFWILLEREMMG